MKIKIYIIINVHRWHNFFQSYLPNMPLSLQKLVSVLRPRIGHFVPRESHPEWHLTKWTATHKNVDIRAIDRNCDEEREKAKEYMRKIFYREAPIPRALGLARAPQEVQDFLNMEMDVYLDSGASISFKNNDTGNLVGVGLCALWAVDKDYQVVDGDAKTWHHAAAILAKERSPEVDPRVTWRDLQYQHIYNLCQMVLQQRAPEKKGVVWAGMLSFEKEAREMGLSTVLMDHCIQVAEEDGVLVGCQSNFPGFDKFLYKHFSNPVLIEETKYADEELEVDGTKVLQFLEFLGSMKFFVNMP